MSLSHPVRHAPPLGGALAARKARDDRFRLARDGVARHLGFWKPPTHPTRQVTRRRTRRTLPGASEKTRLRKRPHASNPPTVPFPLALRAASAATHWQPRVWSGPRMGPKPGTTHHADVPQRLLSEPLPVTDRARVARRDRREIYDSNSPPGGARPVGAASVHWLCVRCQCDTGSAVWSVLLLASCASRPPPRWCARSKKS